MTAATDHDVMARPIVRCVQCRTVQEDRTKRRANRVPPEQLVTACKCGGIWSRYATTEQTA